MKSSASSIIRQVDSLEKEHNFGDSEDDESVSVKSSRTSASSDDESVHERDDDLEASFGLDLQQDAPSDFTALKDSQKQSDEANKKLTFGMFKDDEVHQLNDFASSDDEMKKHRTNAFKIKINCK